MKEFVFDKYLTATGIRVIHLADPGRRGVSLQAWVENGSAHEKPKEKGISHFIEHMLFKKTEKFSGLEKSDLIESCGGRFNAYTSTDQTVYEITVPKKKSLEAFEVLADMVQSPTFDPEEIDIERKVILEELKRGLDSESRQHWRFVYEKIFNHVDEYKDPVIGYEEDIKNFHSEQFKEFFNRRYSSDNLFMVVVGGEKNFFKLKESPNENFDHFKSKSVVEDIPLKAKPEYFFNKTDFKGNNMSLCWTFGDLTTEEENHLTFFIKNRLRGAGSKIYNTLVVDEKKCLSLGGFENLGNYGNFLGIQFLLKNEDSEVELLDSVKKIFEESLFEKLKQEEIDAWINQTNRYEQEKRENTQSLAATFGSGLYFGGDPTYDFSQREEFIKNGFSENLQTVYSLLKKSNLYMLQSKGSPSISSDGDINKSLESFFNFKVEAISGDLVSLGVKEEVVSEKKENKNLEIDYFPQKEKGSWIFMSACRGGMLLEDIPESGVSYLFKQMWLRKTSNLSEREVAKKLSHNALEFGYWSSRFFSGLYLSDFQKNNLDNINLMNLLIEDSSFDQVTFQRERDKILEYKKREKDSALEYTLKNLQKMIFPNQVFSFDQMGDEKKLNDLNLRNILDYKDKLLSQKFDSIWLGSDENLSWCQKTFTTEFPSFLSKQGSQLSFPKPVLGTQFYNHIHLEKEQEQLILGYPIKQSLTNAESEKTLYLLNVLNSYLGGQSGLLFQELREKRGLCYSAGSFLRKSPQGGVLYFYIGCDPAKTQESYDCFKEILDSLLSLPEDIFRSSYEKFRGKLELNLENRYAIADAIMDTKLYNQSLDPILNPDWDWDFKYEDVLSQINNLGLKNKPYVMTGGTKEIKI